MKTILQTAVFAAAICYSSSISGLARAEVFYSRAQSDIVTMPAKPKHDAKIEAAAIEKAAEKIGELRGSLEGDQIGEIITESDLKQDKSSHLGFPIIQESRPADKLAANAVPLV